jgi:Helicase conserved C-terminal domain/SNF2-related domain
MWRSLAEAITAKGLTAVNSRGLAGMAAVRRIHEGQFFTPDAIASLMWRLVSPSLESFWQQHQQKLSLLDNSIGSGRLMAFADPKKHVLYGADTDARCIKALSSDAKSAGFDYEFLHGSMAEIRPHGFAAALINPPFSVTLEAPNLQPFACNSHGRFGALTKALSHRFSLAQALSAASIVAAVLPRSMVAEIKHDDALRPRLAAVLHLPNGAFSNEGAEVATSILLFGPDEQYDLQELTIVDIANQEIPSFSFPLFEIPSHRAGLRQSSSEPVITLPVTHDPTVRVVRGGRRICLKFACGLTEARVLNAIYRGVLREESYDEEQRHPREFKYTGEGSLFIAVHLCQPDPLASFNQLLHQIRNAGGQPVVCPSLFGFLKRQARKLKRHIPLGHMIRGDIHHQTEIVAPTSFPINPNSWGSPVIRGGNTYQVARSPDDKFIISQNGKEVGRMEPAYFEKRFSGVSLSAKPGWAVKSPSRSALFPNVAHQWTQRMEQLGISDWLSWKYQTDDLVELCLCPKGGIVAWSMGLGKARLAIALCLLRGGTHNLIAVEAHLIDEMEAELRKLEIPEETWQTIRGPGALLSLRKVNLISYNRLRMPVSTTRPRITYAHKLRRRIRLLIADEGHLLRHNNTEQSRALWRLAPGIRYILTGTPLANYPRDILPIVSYVYGDASPYQPYGLRGTYLTPELITSTVTSCRGMDKFRDDYVTLEWVTNEFSEDMQEGAKREIPAIANLDKYRSFISPLVKRRVAEEPEVAAHVNIPVPTETVTTVQWDPEHLEFYLKVAEEFRNWYLDLRRRSGEQGKHLNLIALLARIGAVIDAANQPHMGVRDFAAFTPVTSKQRAVIQRIQERIAENDKVLVFCHSPKAVKRLHQLLSQQDIESVVMHGEISQGRRTRDLQGEFRLGDVPVLLATKGVARTGLNIPEANAVLFYDRDWASFVERQAKARVLRPQQKKPVTVEYFHLPGSVDVYQAQLVSYKSDAADSGLDWATPTQDPQSFLHLDTVLGRFVEDLGESFRVGRHNVKEIISPLAIA